VEEVRRILAHVSPAHLFIIQLLYGSGLRLSELVRLRVKDIDFDSKLIFVRSAKGDKDRSTILPESVLPPLRVHIEKVRKIHQDDLNSEKTIQDIVKRAVRSAKITKPASVHTLRHSFATHLLMSGTNIRIIQELLGHQNLETTMIYTHVFKDLSQAPQSPLDSMLR
jgi:site-specific recombinase XerD